MSCYFSITIDMSFTAAVESTKEALQRHGFRLLAEIDMKDDLKRSLNVDIRPYLILGLCNPDAAYRALQTDERLGLLLPCNVIVQQLDEGDVEVTAVDPASAMAPIDHIAIARIARDVRSDLRDVIADVGEVRSAAGARPERSRHLEIGSPQNSARNC
jgi:uncharacterized protein (DUF302 family)